MIKSKIKFVPNKMHVKSGDTVVVISGSDKDKVGKVVKSFPKTGKIIVEGVNVRTKHLKPRTADSQGEKVQVEMPIFASKVMLWDAEAKSGTRVRYEMKDGKKVRISVKTGKEI